MVKAKDDDDNDVIETIFGGGGWGFSAWPCAACAARFHCVHRAAVRCNDY